MKMLKESRDLLSAAALNVMGIQSPFWGIGVNGICIYW